MKTLNRYLLFQTPGWGIAAVIALAVWLWVGLNPWLVGGLWALWVIKDFVLYPLLKGAYQRNVKTGADLLVGKIGICQRRIDPRGFVRVRSELWKAEVEAGEAPIEPGATVRVLRARGLTLVVVPADEQAEAGEVGARPQS